MNLNENDARAVDMLLNGLLGGSAAAGVADGQATSGNAKGVAAGGVKPAGAASAVNAMSEDLANRVTRVDDMLRLLDYLPADEPPANLVQRTMRRVEEARAQGRLAPAAAGAHAGAARSGHGVSPGLRRSPAAGGDEDPVTA